MLKKPYLKVQNLQFGFFPKIHPYWWDHPSLRMVTMMKIVAKTFDWEIFLCDSSPRSKCAQGVNLVVQKEVEQ